MSLQINQQGVLVVVFKLVGDISSSELSELLDEWDGKKNLPSKKLC